MTPTKPKPDNLEKARTAWGEQPPEWIIALAEACNAENQTAIGKRIGYAGSTVSQLLSNSYPGDVGRIEQLVRGALMSETVRCPVLQEIGRDICLGWQRRPFSTASANAVRMHQACRNNCPHSRIKETNSEPV
ncbi:hypothetical protein [Agrobacterium sp. SUL3]|uniref:hypothetical protein n=1 Tax=Agrobacterium sp. SUL3 TaxID=1701910 RepID=UPI0006997BEB|nr:hypothetical protein [Agrobacterium sp. SUL3]KNY35709.1 transcriptional regulator [Agrobacterium sp. SUL3]